mmetsp:Transcript_1790/g.5577  ORF Transcript_1790/g.5577 Transcript_1790/m.5577 type:complete len:177 (-) Transcript_1790:71-601(-)
MSSSAVPSSHVGSPPSFSHTESTSQAIETLSREVLGTIQALDNASVLIEDYRTDSHERLIQTFNEIVDQFSKVERTVALNPDLAEIQVPLALLDCVDKGKNPELFTKQSLDECVAQNKATKGRLDALRVFRDTLESELEQAFPEDAKLFHNLVERYERDSMDTTTTSSSPARFDIA